MTSSQLELAADVARLLEGLGIRYVIGGSVASSLAGEPRSTVDIDMAVRLDEAQLASLVDKLRPSFHVPTADAARAVRERDSFNLIHNQAISNVDLFVLGDGILDTDQIERRKMAELPTDPPTSVWITSTEDQVLRKLDSYRRGGEVSDRQRRCASATRQASRNFL